MASDLSLEMALDNLMVTRDAHRWLPAVKTLGPCWFKCEHADTLRRKKDHSRGIGK